MSRRALWIVALVVTVVLGAYVTAARRTPGPPLDPASTAPDGAKAVVELAGRLGADVEVVDGTVPADADVALVLDDRFSRDQAEEVRAWVAGGGILVVADPTSLFTPPPTGSTTGTVTDRCDVGALDDVRTIDVGTSRTYAPEPGATSCFEVAGDPFLMITRDGSGTVVSLGGPHVFTNDRLDEVDNAVLAAALVVPGDAPRLAFVRPAVAGSGDRGLLDLVGTPVRGALGQLLIAFLALVLWRARRLGRPIDEPQLVRIDGSELTGAVARLLEQNRRPDRAAAILRDRARRDLSGPLGLALDAPTPDVVTVISARTSLDARDAHRAVAGTVATDGDLVEVAELLVRIRQEVLHDRDRSVPV